MAKNKTIKASKASRNIYILFCVVGAICFLVGAYFLIDFLMTSPNYEEIPATISRIERHTDPHGDVSYDVYVSYTYKGEQYTSIPLNAYDSSMDVGDEITIQVNRSDPYDIRSKHVSVLLFSIFLGLGTFVCGVTTFLLVRYARKNRASLLIRKKGTPVACIVTAVRPDPSYLVNGRMVNNILTCAPAQDPAQNFQSPPYPAKYFVSPGSSITVYVMQEGAREYYVDLASLKAAPLPNGTMPAPAPAPEPEPAPAPEPASQENCAPLMPPHRP